MCVHKADELCSCLFTRKHQVNEIKLMSPYVRYRLYPCGVFFVHSTVWYKIRENDDIVNNVWYSCLIRSLVQCEEVIGSLPFYSFNFSFLNIIILTAYIDIFAALSCLPE